MNVLVAVSSKHGSTREIAEAIAETIREEGVAVELRDAQLVESIATFDAVIVGSALYLGRWLAPARDLVTRSAEVLRTRPVWLFSSGPMGHDIVDPADAAEGNRLLAMVEGRTHRVFAGKADKHALGFGERTILRLVGNPYGDHRDWSAIREWATSICKDLESAPAPAPSPPAEEPSGNLTALSSMPRGGE